MILLYLLLILLGSFPLVITLLRIRKYRSLQKNGPKVLATVTQLSTHRSLKGLLHDLLTLAYLHPKSGLTTTGHTQTVYNKYKIGDQVSIVVEPNKTKVIIPGDVRGFYPALGFSILVFLFMVFATFKVKELFEMGY